MSTPTVRDKHSPIKGNRCTVQRPDITPASNPEASGGSGFPARTADGHPLLGIFDPCKPSLVREVEDTRSPGPAAIERFVKVAPSLLFRSDLTSTETLLIEAIGLYDWGVGRGGWPSNDRLVEVCKLKADGPDCGHGAIRRLLRGLQNRGFLRIEMVEQSRDNPTGRVIYLTPCEQIDPGRPDPETPGAQTRRPRALAPAK